ncbi:MAG TPA: hypothetical protein VMA75_02030 [Candidatus Paceibacterota bacterium]|nr:hypothetical protein [Candidatus Paceibacterota bacterium]
MKKFGAGERIGGGSDNDVHEDSNNPNRVIAIRKEGKEDTEDRERKIKARFYLKKILHILFPQNIPDVDLATSNPQATRRERVILDPLHQSIQHAGELEAKLGEIPKEAYLKASDASDKIYEDPKYKQLIGSLEELGVEIDTTTCNFTYSENGDALIYLDDVHLEDADWQTKNPRGFDEEKLEAAISKIADERQQERATIYLDRLKALTLAK